MGVAEQMADFVDDDRAEVGPVGADEALVDPDVAAVLLGCTCLPRRQVVVREVRARRDVAPVHLRGLSRFTEGEGEPRGFGRSRWRDS